MIAMDTKSKFEMVATGRLKIDPLYQRPLNDRRVEKMATEWSEILAQTIDVSVRNGSLYVIDGQHRLAAARRASVQHLAATIHTGLSPSDEAALFVALNTKQVRPTINDIFKAKIEAQDPSAHAILRAAGACGVEIDVNKSGGRARKPNVCRAVGALIAVESIGGEALVRDTLTVPMTAWPEDQRALDAVVIYGVAAFITTYEMHPRYEYGRIARKLGELSTGAFLRRANALTEASGPVSGGGNNPNSTVIQKAGPRRAVLEAFNRDLRGERLPDAGLRELRAIRYGQNPWVEAA